MSDLFKSPQDETTSVSNYGRPNDVFIRRIDIVSQQGGSPISLIEQMADMVIYEDMRSPAIRGKIVLGEAMNLASGFPFIGNEMLDIEFETPTSKTPFKILCTVTSIDRITRSETDRAEMYELNFVTPYFVAQTQRKLTGAIKGTIAAMASTILADNHQAEAVVDPTAGLRQFIIPYWTPVQTLNWLANRAISRENGLCGFMYWEDRDGPKFVDVLNLLKNPSVGDYDFRPNSPAITSSLEAYIRHIQDITIHPPFDRMEAITNGMHASAAVSYDMTRKRYLYKERRYSDRFNETPHLNRYPLFPATNRMHEIPTAVFRQGIDQTYKFGKSLPRNDAPLDWILERNEFLGDMFRQKLDISVPGDTRLVVGDIININLTKSGYLDDTTKQPFDMFRSGRHLVTAIKHAINRSGHVMSLECVKDSMPKGIPDAIKSGFA